MLAPDTRYYRSQLYIDTDTDTGNDVPIAWGKRTLHMFQNITPLTLCFEMYETNSRLETTGVHATVLTVETGK